MSAAQWLTIIYHYYPLAFFIDFVVLQLSLRFSYWRGS